MKRLRRERIDLYPLHRVDSKVPMEDSLGALKKMQDAGKIRYVGLSKVSPEELERARGVLPIATVQNQYNIGNRRWEKTLTYCEREGLRFLPWSLIDGNRSLHDDALKTAAKDYHASAVARAAVASSPISVTLPIPGTSSVAHLEENMAEAKLKLSEPKNANELRLRPAEMSGAQRFKKDVTLRLQPPTGCKTWPRTDDFRALLPTSPRQTRGLLLLTAFFPG